MKHIHDMKIEVRSYWSEHPCETDITSSPKFSREYFDEIEEYRYRVNPEIFTFAQFTRYRDRKVLEVGVGAGTDFIQWVRAGAKAYGIDLTEEAIEHVKKRLAVYGLSAEECKVADAEHIPFPDNMFDLVYSWGVIHHTPDLFRALGEMIRVARAGGSIKIMIYNRRSLGAFYRYLKYGLFRGRPFRKISDILWNDIESIGTKALTRTELKSILSGYPVEIKTVCSRVTNSDLLWNRPLILRMCAYVLACLLGFNRCGWFMTVELEKNSR